MHGLFIRLINHSAENADYYERNKNNQARGVHQLQIFDITSSHPYGSKHRHVIMNGLKIGAHYHVLIIFRPIRKDHSTCERKRAHV